jgi:hypothetical protein
MPSFAGPARKPNRSEKLILISAGTGRLRPTQTTREPFLAANLRLKEFEEMWVLVDQLNALPQELVVEKQAA